METDNPHNFLMIDKIMRQALSASLLEAYLEAAPQIIIQSQFHHHFTSSFFYESVYCIFSLITV